MTVTFYPSKLSGTVSGISSKSYLHRLLICAALSEGETKIAFNTMSKDISATISAISAFGKTAKAENGKLVVSDGPVCSSINVNESGSTFRFILPILSARRAVETVEINGSDYLATRPISPLYEELVANGAVISEKGKFPMTVSGQLRCGKYTLPGNISSQFVSGLLLALPMVDGDSEIHIEGELQSKPYVDITLECMKLFGMDIDETDYGYFVKGGRKYISPAELVCENDYSNAAFFLVAGALSEEFVGVENLNPDTCQGDSEAVSILERFGAKKCVNNGNISFAKDKLVSVDIDATNIPDLVPILSLAASVASGETRIYGAERLRFKESDRLRSVSTVLNSLGADITETDDGLIIKGVNKLKGGKVDSFNDHRIAMTAAIASCVSDGEIVVENFEAITKSYPDFLDDFAKVGGKFKTEV